MNILLIGNSGRAHALAEAFRRSPQNPKLFSYMSANNPGVAKLSEKVEIGAYDDLEKIKDFAKDNEINFALIGPEAPLAAGVADVLEEIGVKSVGPKKVLAQLETSKSFTRDLLAKYSIEGNARFKVFTSEEGVKEFMEELDGQFVVKADGLKGGKGVKVVGDHLQGIDDGFEYAKECLADDGRVIIEEKFVGEEFSVQCLTDGITVIPTPAAQDHKRAYVGDKGPNTGGMGSYSDVNHLLPFLKQEDVDKALEITKKVAKALKEETGEYYKGVMYGGFILTKDGVKLVEYNARFADPEAMNILPILKSDLVEICQAIINQTLDQINVEFENKATVCKYTVPEGYPENPSKGEEIDITEVPEDVKMYFASVSDEDGRLVMSSSRAVAFVGIADTLEEAEKIAQKGVESIKGKVFYREDIGTKELIQKRIDHVKELRGE